MREALFENLPEDLFFSTRRKKESLIQLIYLKYINFPALAIKIIVSYTKRNGIQNIRHTSPDWFVPEINVKITLRFIIVEINGSVKI